MHTRYIEMRTLVAGIVLLVPLAASVRAQRLVPDAPLRAMVEPAAMPLEHAAPPFVPPESGLLLRILTPMQLLNHDDNVVAGSGSAEVLPAVNPGVGFGMTVGMRDKSMGEVDVSYQRTYHSASGVDAFRSSFRAIDVQWRVHGRPKEQLQPYLMAAGGIQEMRVTDGSVSATSTEEARFGGPNWQLGGGATYFVSPHLSVFVEAAYRSAHYRHVEGIADGQLQEWIRSRGIRVAPGVAFRFGPSARTVPGSE